MESFDSKTFEEILNFNLTPRSTFSRARIELTQDAIKYVLGEKGYAFPEIVFNVEFNDESSFVDIDFRVDPKAKSYVRRINIVGNTKTNDEVYRRELRQFESSLYGEGKVERSKIRLQRLKFVNNVEVKKSIVDESLGLIDIDFVIEETQSGEFKVGAGYSDSSGTIFNIKVQQDNFLGKGNNVALELEKTSYKQLVRYSNTNPYFTTDGKSKTTSLVFSETDVTGTSTASYLSDTFAYGVNYSVPISETKSYGYGGEVVLIDYTTTIGSPQNVTNFINEYGETHFGFRLSANYTEDTRDRVVYASTGKRQSILTSMYIPPDLEYSYGTIRFVGEYNKPFTLNFLNMFDWNTVLQTKPQLGLGLGLIETSKLPFHDKFYAGGDRTVRGFDSNSLRSIKK